MDFFCDSKKLFLEIAYEFEHAYRLEATITGKEIEGGAFLNEVKRTKYECEWGKKEYNAKLFFDEAIMDYDAKREFLKYLLMVGQDKAHNDIYSEFEYTFEHKYEEWYDRKCACKVGKCAFDMPDDNMKYFAPTVEKCIIFEGVDFQGLYKELENFLPGNLALVKEKEQIILEYGSGFTKKDEVLDYFKKSVCTKDTLLQIRKTQEEINTWTKRLEDKSESKDFVEGYIEILLEKIKILEIECCHDVRQRLKEFDFDLTSTKKCKDLLLRQLMDMQKPSNAEINLYKDYCKKESQLEKMLSSIPRNIDDGRISQYVEFYHMGRILIGNRLNQLGNNVTKERQISQNELDCAMKYFYETHTAQEAYKMQKEEEYRNNRKKGQIGEKEVDYALKWLDKSYLVVPKIWNERYGQESIELINLDFIDEKQEYDNIVIGKQGVFVIETKNYAGKLIIDSGGNWIREREDGTRVGERNPFQQVDRHEKLLKSFLRKEMPVIGLICLSNPKVIIEGREHCPLPLVKSDLLTKFIEDYPSNGRGLSDDEKNECLSQIEKHRYK